MQIIVIMKVGNVHATNCQKQLRKQCVCSQWGLYLNGYYLNEQCVKTARIGSYSGPHFSRIFPNPDWISPYTVRKQENARKMRTRITPNADTFYAVEVLDFFSGIDLNIFSTNSKMYLTSCQTFMMNSFQKQSSRGVFIERCSKNMQQIYRRTTMSKCDFNKAV